MGGWGSSPMAAAHKAKSILASFDVDDRVIVGWKRAIQECWLCVKEGLNGFKASSLL